MKKLLFLLILTLLLGTACAEQSAETILEAVDFHDLESFAAERGFDLSISKVMDFLKESDLPDWPDIKSFLLEQLKNPLRKPAAMTLELAAPVLMLVLTGAALPKGGSGAKFVCRCTLYAGCVRLMLLSLNEARSCLETTAAFSDVAAPVLAAVLTAGGMTGASALISPSAALAGNLIEKAFLKYGLPVSGALACVSIASNLSDSLDLSRLIRLLRKLAAWAEGLAVASFTALILLKGNAVSISDSLALRTAKYAVDSASGVIGSGVSDVWDAYLSGLTAAKNTVGFSGAIALLSVCLKPMLTMAAVMLLLNLLSMFLGLAGDKAAGRALEQLSGVCQMELSLCGGAMAVWIILMGAAMSLERGF